MKVEEREGPLPMSVDEGIGNMYVEGPATYESLPDKPKLNGTVLSGNVSLDDIGISAIPLAEIRDMFKEW